MGSQKVWSAFQEWTVIGTSPLYPQGNSHLLPHKQGMICTAERQIILPVFHLISKIFPATAKQTQAK